MESFQLEDYDFIELNKLLKIMNWVTSGGEAKQVIDLGLVKVNSEVETRRRKKLRKGDIIEYQNQKVEVKK
jgi:ribosome-associated protein